MRVVVVGGGVIGLLTAVECIRAGANVELVEQSELPSPSATSYDRHRVVRALHRGNAALTRAGARAEVAWRTVERRLGARFYHRVGSLTALPASQVADQLALLAQAGVTGEALSPAQLASRYPHLRLPAGLAGVLDPAAGAVLADRALTALTGWLRAQPAVRLYTRRPAVAVAETSVRLAEGTVVVGDRVVLAAGPWSRALAPAALTGELTLYRQSTLAYDPGIARAQWAGTPAIPVLGTSRGAWLIPPVADTPVRLSAASACRAVPELTDRVTPAPWREHLIEEFRALLVGFDPAAVVGAADSYYLADDAAGGPRLARFGAGFAYLACGGMSFKFAPLIAAAIADHVLGRPVRPSGLVAVDQPRRLQPSSRG